MLDIVASALVTISATIGKPGLILYGYTSPSALVTVSGEGVSDRTYANEKGYFRFENVFTPVFTYPEICLQSTDRNSLESQPTCLPPLPAGALKYSVGPVYLSPTISFSANNVKSEDFASAFGSAVPNSDVEIYIAKDQNPNKLAVVREANAYYVPTYKTRTDANGNYEFSLPTADAGVYRIFTGTIVGEDPSAKSTTLTFSVFSKAQAYWETILAFLQKYLVVLLILLEILIIALLIVLIFRSRRRHTRHLVSKVVL